MFGALYNILPNNPGMYACIMVSMGKWPIALCFLQVGGGVSGLGEKFSQQADDQQVTVYKKGSFSIHLLFKNEITFILKFSSILTQIEFQYFKVICFVVFYVVYSHIFELPRAIYPMDGAIKLSYNFPQTRKVLNSSSRQ